MESGSVSQEKNIWVSGLGVVLMYVSQNHVKLLLNIL